MDIRVGTEASLANITELKPDVIFIATGATARPHGLEVAQGHSIVSAWDVLLGKYDDFGKTLLVIDEEYDHQGPTTAALLLERGYEVDLITSQETIGNFLGATTRPRC